VGALPAPALLAWIRRAMPQSDGAGGRSSV
jgi:hypothetical protein